MLFDANGLITKFERINQINIVTHTHTHTDIGSNKKRRKRRRQGQRWTMWLWSDNVRSFGDIRQNNCHRRPNKRHTRTVVVCTV